jgi:hypothetical protein
MQLWSTGTDGERERWRRILGLIHHPLCAVGGAVRSGLGRLVPTCIRTTAFDLAGASGREAFRAARAHGDGFLTRLDHPWPDGIPDVDAPTSTDWAITVIADEDLQVTDFIRVGQGRDALLTGTGRAREPDLCPFAEPAIDWSDPAEARVDQWVVVPGSGIKGALRHRTIFHLGRLLGGSFAEDTNGSVSEAVRTEERQLFGDAKGRTGGRAGRVFVEDIFVAKVADPTIRSCVMPHNSIDRFLGGVRHGFLFSEQLLWRLGPLRVRLLLDDADRSVSTVAMTALRLAVDDMRTGRLPWGGGTGRGHGTLGAVTSIAHG